MAAHRTSSPWKTPHVLWKPARGCYTFHPDAGPRCGIPAEIRSARCAMSRPRRASEPASMHVYVCMDAKSTYFSQLNACAHTRRHTPRDARMHACIHTLSCALTKVPPHTVDTHRHTAPQISMCVFASCTSTCEYANIAYLIQSALPPAWLPSNHRWQTYSIALDYARHSRELTHMHVFDLREDS